MELRKFNIREADWQADGKQLSNIRRLVFIVEQKVPREEEWDGKDEQSWHWIATDDRDHPIGTARLLPDGQIGRMAVLSNYRQLGVGAALLEQAVEKARHLGFTGVYLNAQTHALGFYQRAGFTPAGETFMEAGIPHIRMTQALAPPVDNIQRRLAVDSALDMSVKPFDTAEVLWQDHAGSIRRVRRQIFATELNIAGYGTEDDAEPEAIHWIADNNDGHIIGVIRMKPTGEISQLGVLPEFRRQGVGTSLVELAIQRARRFSLDQVTLTAPATAEGFLAARGFSRVDGDSFRLNLEPEDRSVQQRPEAGASMSDSVAFRLGEDKQLILLRSEGDFRNIILEMTRQARQSIRIYSPLLAHELFDNQALLDVCSGLARRNRYTRIEILVFNPHRIIKNGHALLTIARKLPTSIGIKVVDPEMRQQNHEYVLVDGQGFIYRQEHDTYEGTANFADVTECNRLGRQFTASWESGLLDPNLRQLRV